MNNNTQLDSDDLLNGLYICKKCFRSIHCVLLYYVCTHVSFTVYSYTLFCLFMIRIREYSL